MAGDHNTMLDLEDGEISGSDSEAEMWQDSRQQMNSAAFKSRETLQATCVTSYRSSIATASSDSNSDSEEESALWRRKRQKCFNLPPPRPPTASGISSNGAGHPQRKINNIWGSVVQEQSQEAVAAELGILGMEAGVSMNSRQSETYNYMLARKLIEKERQEEEHGMEAMLDSQLEEYMQHNQPQEEKGDGQFKRKRTVKERLGPRAEMDYKGRYELNPDDPDEKVIDEIAHRLMEPKKDLLERVVKVIGAKKAIEILSETASIEQSGGLHTVDGSRRRTPGGVYLYLLKNTPSISNEQIKEIFYDENQKDYNNKKAAKKRQRHIVAKKMKQAINTLNLQEHDDGSRETFASDTNDALESLEEATEDLPDTALGTEDTPVVYNSNDLEVF